MYQTACNVLLHLAKEHSRLIHGFESRWANPVIPEENALCLVRRSKPVKGTRLWNSSQRFVGAVGTATSGRASGTKPSRFGIFTPGSVRESRTSDWPMIPLRYRRYAVTA